MKTAIDSEAFPLLSIYLFSIVGILILVLTAYAIFLYDLLFIFEL